MPGSDPSCDACVIGSRPEIVLTWESAVDHGHRAKESRWNLQDLDFGGIDIARIHERDELFMLVCSASFIESGSAVYARNLVSYFAGDAEICDWLQEHWEPEELQHGVALKAYVQTVWPEFNWSTAYADLQSQYSKLCIADNLEPTRGQEMAARCVVEMGTTTYYHALNAVCDEPILRGITRHIRNDELRHYKHFYRYFLRYQLQEPVTRAQVIAALWRRVTELRKSDTEIALRYAALWGFRGREQPPSFDDIRNRVFGLMRGQYPIELAVKMTLKPLQLNARLEHWAERPLGGIARRVLRG